MLSDERIEKVARSHGTGGWQTLDDMCRFARAVEREATAPLIEQIKQLSDQADRAVSVAECANKQIKEDEALMRDVFNAYENGVGMIAAINALRQRLETKT